MRVIKRSHPVESDYINIRKILGTFIGQRVVDITQHDKEDYDENGECYVMLLFENGDYLKFPIGEEGFFFSEDEEDAG